jgi:phospholipase/carboxylesterase
MSPSSASPSRAIDLVLLLHGVGSAGSDLLGLAEAWRPKLAGIGFCAPDAPHPFDGAAMGRQWFSVLGVTAANRAGRIAAAVAAFDAVVDERIAAAGTTRARTVLAGFSQGTIMALDAVGRGRRFAGVIGFSGRLVGVPEGRLDGLPILLVHGEADRVIPASESETARAVLAAAGAEVDLRRLPGEGHGIGPAAAAAGLSFLKRLADAVG